MCGIFGIVSKSNTPISFKITQNIVNTLFELSSTRGKESSGIAIKNLKTNNISIYKDAISSSKLIKDKEYKDFFYHSLHQNFNPDSVISPFALIGHSRLVTNGSQDDNNNNQPVIKNGIVAVHNGIAVNVDELWKNHSDINRSYTVDTEIIIELFKKNLNAGLPVNKSIGETFKEIYGATTIALLSDNLNKLIIASNNGSLYCLFNEANDIYIFASERYILTTLIEKLNLEKILGKLDIYWVNPGHGYVIDINNPDRSGMFSVNDDNGKTENFLPQKDSIQDLSPLAKKKTVLINTGNADHYRSLLEYNLNEISNLKRCTKCLLPESFPFIEFDDKGVCSICKNYKKIEYKGIDKLNEIIEPFKSISGNPDCLIPFSGGRDSSYNLHLAKNVLGLNPIAFTYDWGMVTDLARRNQSRLCGKLGIEHIIVSADINRKRENIRKNVAAWLKKPSLGTIPLFMAGDKQYFYYAELLKKHNNIKITLMGENYLEKTGFKTGFTGAHQTDSGFMAYHISLQNKIKMISFYSGQFITNPAYINSSLLDTLSAFISYYMIPHNYINVYNYVNWDEQIIEQTLLNEYDWELSPDTKTTWRIGDGTAPFYNYIYYTVAGFSEIDTFRSNQIREGVLTREEALLLVNEENKPRYESIKWYLDTINLDFEAVIKRINQIPKLYI